MLQERQHHKLQLRRQRLRPPPGTAMMSSEKLDSPAVLARKDPVLVLGFDVTHLGRQSQFLVCASGVFGFLLLYFYLQELISVHLCNRKLGLFLASAQFAGYTVLASGLRGIVSAKEQKQQQSGGGVKIKGARSVGGTGGGSSVGLRIGSSPLPSLFYVGLSLLRAIDLAMSNLAMQYVNYPAKTLIMSSRVAFTMLFGVVLTNKSYNNREYAAVFCMCVGLALFLHADATSSAVFHPTGVLMLVVCLVCDAALSNLTEVLMNRYGVGQDEFIFRMYSIAWVAMTVAAAWKGDLRQGFVWMTQPGTFDELTLPVEQRTWSASSKLFCLVLYSSAGFFGSSCAAAITKNFGALAMSITSTTQKAMTLFLSFALFGNACTAEHLAGIVTFLLALTAKSLWRRQGDNNNNKKPRDSPPRELEMGISTDLEGATSSKLHC